MKQSHRAGPVLAVVALAVSFAFAAISYGATVPGEKWQHKITMQMQGMTMPMPTREVCVPVGKAAEELAKPDKNCVVSNTKQSGNKFSADIKCTGKEAMEGSMEMTTGPDSMSGRMRVRSDAGEMTMVTEAHKLGACQAVDTGALVAQANAQAKAGQATAAQAVAQQCSGDAYSMKSEPGKIVQAAVMFLQPQSVCAGKPLPADFCSTLQSRGGFSALSQGQTAMPGVLDRSMTACKLGSGKAAVDALRAKLVASAEADGDGEYLVTNAPDRAKALARSQCLVKGEMWGGRSAKWDTFCDSDFAAQARSGR